MKLKKPSKAELANLKAIQAIGDNFDYRYFRRWLGVNTNPEWQRTPVAHSKDSCEVTIQYLKQWYTNQGLSDVCIQSIDFVTAPKGS